MGTPDKQNDTPQWDLDTIYRGFDSSEYRDDKANLKKSIGDLVSSIGRTSVAEKPIHWAIECINAYNKAADLHEHLESYTYARFSTNTNDEISTREMNSIEELTLPLKSAMVDFRNKLASVSESLSIGQDEKLEPFRHFLDEQLVLQKKQMPSAQEDLAADLSRPGGSAWGRLQEAMSSNLNAVWDEDKGETKSVTQLRALAFSSERAVRERAYQLELGLWKSVEIPMAFSLNGVKGFSICIDRRRTYEDALERPLLQSQVTSKTLDALIEAMTASLPIFRKYLVVKAKLIGVEKLCFYDLFAPVGVSDEIWSFAETSEFIVDRFSDFSGKLGAFAQKTFKERWIDAEQRGGKIGGGYCTSFPLSKSSRIFCNFDGSFSALTTIAHELGHAYHHHILRDDSHIHRDYPMTLAETASIFSQTIVFDAALRQSDEEIQIHLIEEFLQDSTQIIVDILSRYIFEKNVFEKRKKAELSAREFCELMTEAQKETYGDALSEQNLHPYMWAVKGHYYDQDLSFYNFPYAFGLLFSMGLFSRYQSEGREFVSEYDSLLANTARMSANDVAKQAGFDIEQPEFWSSAVDSIGDYVDRFTKLAD